MPPMTFRIADSSDATALAALAEETFRDTYEGESDPANLEAFVGDTFGEAHQRAELLDPNTLTIVGEIDGRLQCYAQLQLTASPPPEVDPTAVRLWRFYVRAPHHGRGVAQALMQEVTGAAQRAGTRVVWLGVWADNARAIAFYRKCGFIDVGTHDCHLGTEMQHDRVMILRLDAAGHVPPRR